jgi:lipoprotein signal peptidase
MAIPCADPAYRGRVLFILVPVLLIGLLADQRSKAWASSLPIAPRVLVPGYVIAYPMQNAGMILGDGRSHALNSTILALFGIALGARMVQMIYADRRRWRTGDWLAGALLLGGMAGNTWDRLVLGHVRDFIVTRAAPTVIFNVADVLVVAGISGLLISRFLSDRSVKREGRDPGGLTLPMAGTTATLTSRPTSGVCVPILVRKLVENRISGSR